VKITSEEKSEPFYQTTSTAMSEFNPSKDIKESAVFMVLATKNYLRELKDYTSLIALQVTLAKVLNKPVFIMMDVGLTDLDKNSIRDYFKEHNVIKELPINRSDKNSIENIVKEIMNLTKSGILKP
jgi:hypothetical protein